jgi:hypothetical protein
VSNCIALLLKSEFRAADAKSEAPRFPLSAAARENSRDEFAGKA